MFLLIFHQYIEISQKIIKMNNIGAVNGKKSTEKKNAQHSSTFYFAKTKVKYGARKRTKSGPNKHQTSSAIVT